MDGPTDKSSGRRINPADSGLRTTDPGPFFGTADSGPWTFLWHYGSKNIDKEYCEEQRSMAGSRWLSPTVRCKEYCEAFGTLSSLARVCTFFSLRVIGEWRRKGLFYGRRTFSIRVLLVQNGTSTPSESVSELNLAFPKCTREKRWKMSQKSLNESAQWQRLKEEKIEKEYWKARSGFCPFSRLGHRPNSMS